MTKVNDRTRIPQATTQMGYYDTPSSCLCPDGDIAEVSLGYLPLVVITLIDYEEMPYEDIGFIACFTLLIPFSVNNFFRKFFIL